jgi:outer membrane protein insertion porin family
LNSFFGGPDLVRGFAVNGFGPRDVTEGTSKDNVGGTRYWATKPAAYPPVDSA